MAAKSPAAVVTSASEIPGATAARLAEPAAALAQVGEPLLVLQGLQEADRVGLSAAQRPVALEDHRPGEHGESEQDQKNELDERPGVGDETQDIALGARGRGRQDEA